MKKINEGIVPDKPTEEMLEAGRRMFEEVLEDYNNANSTSAVESVINDAAINIWSAMISAHI